MSKLNLDTKAALELVQEISLQSDEIANGCDNAGAVFILKKQCTLFLEGNVPDIEKIRDCLEDVRTGRASEYVEKINLLLKSCSGPEKGNSKEAVKSKDKSANAALPMVPVGDLHPHKAVQDFYPISPEILESLIENMKLEKYDLRFPVQACKGDDGALLVWDGLSRLEAAKKAGIKEIPVMISSFKDEDEMMLKVIQAQTLRRDFNDQVIIATVKKLDEICAKAAKERQGHKATSIQCCTDVNTRCMTANEAIARIINRSATTVAHVKKVIKHPEFERAVLAGKRTVNEAYNLIVAEEKESEGPEASPQDKAPVREDSPAVNQHDSGEDAEQTTTEQASEKDKIGADTQKSGSDTEAPNIPVPSEPAPKKLKNVSADANPVPIENTKTIVVTIDMLKFLFKYIPEDNYKRLLFLNRKCSEEVTELMRTVPALRKKLFEQPLPELKGDMGF